MLSCGLGKLGVRFLESSLCLDQCGAERLGSWVQEETWKGHGTEGGNFHLGSCSKASNLAASVLQRIVNLFVLCAFLFFCTIIASLFSLTTGQSKLL